MIICGNAKCSSEIPETAATCPTCGWYAGPPNVRAAQRQEEKDALKQRYFEALNKSLTNGSEQALNTFDENMKATCAVVNVELDFLHQFITNGNAIYSNYELSVKGQTRKPARGRDDRHRRAIEAMLFGGYAEEIRYAALSLDGAGLKSYGQYAMRLGQFAVANRATLLEDNSYHFIPKHKVEPGKDIPPGHISTWGDRHKLAVAKLSGGISSPL